MVQMMRTIYIVGKKIAAVGLAPLELFPFVIFVSEVCIFLHNFYTFCLIKFIPHLHHYALQIWYENRGCGASFIRIMNAPLLFCQFDMYLDGQLFSVKVFSGTAAPTSLKFRMNVRYELLYCRKEIRGCKVWSFRGMSLCYP